MNGRRARSDNKCHTCNKTFSKSEHLARHIRSHTKQKPYECRSCGKAYSRSDVLRRHEKTHHDTLLQSPPSDSRASFPFSRRDSMIPTSSAEPNIQQTGSNHSMVLPPVMSDHCAPMDDLPETQAPTTEDMNLDDLSLGVNSSDWFLGAELDVEALDLTLSSAIFEWAQPPVPSEIGSRSVSTSNVVTYGRLVDAVKKKWFTYLSPPEEQNLHGQVTSGHGVSIGGGKLQVDDSYRAGLSLELQHRLHDEALPSSDQLNLFAQLFFSRFLPLFPVIHAPTFRLTAENTLLFLSLCSVGSLFVGSSTASMQGMRIFERLNKAILASWESILSRTRAKALSMVQAAIFGQTFAILSGRPRDLVLADVLHGTVMSWARESNKNSIYGQENYEQSNIDLESSDVVEKWHRWIEKEQRSRVEIALNIHDAELSNLLHHDPIRKHRLTQIINLASDDLFAAPTAAKWVLLYQQATRVIFSHLHTDDYFPVASRLSRFSAYGTLESIGALLKEARCSNSLNDNLSQYLSDLLIQWWQKYGEHLFQNEGDDPFSLPILWHSIYMSLYADMDLLEQAVGRNGQVQAITVSTTVRDWACSLEASKCLIHAVLIQRYLERMRFSSEPAIHVPRGIFSAGLAWFCFTCIGSEQAIDPKALEAREIQLLNSEIAVQETQGPPLVDSIGSVNNLHRLIDLLQRVGRWSIAKAFAAVLCTALDERGEE